MASTAAMDLVQQIIDDWNGADFYGFAPNLLATLIDAKFVPLRQRIIDLGGVVSDAFDPTTLAPPLPKQT